MSTKAQPFGPEADELLQAYRPIAGTHDELVDNAGTPRPHWEKLINAIEDLPARERQARARRLDRQVRETGLAHDIYADPSATPQQWRLNLMPLILPVAEWQWLERALIQRAQLFNLILADIYGPQKLMAAGLLPAGLIFADSAYLRNCKSILPRNGHLQFYAADVARSADGTWRVIDNHAETPAGIGYAVANRVMHADVAGDILVDCNIRRLAGYFQKLQASFEKLGQRSDPGIALLTPGPSHPDYFSHAYLARYLGYHLVEGGDLRVVGDAVFLKTLEGLKPIDLIVRCTEGLRSDPLELDPSSYDAPAGLVHATRTNPSLVANAIGSAIIENRGLGGFLPRLCQEVLGEDLMLLDAPRWWLGDPKSRAQIEEAREDLVIRSAREGTGRPGSAELGRSLREASASQRAALLQEMGMRGASLVAEQRLGFGTMPVLTQQGLRPRAFAVRLFVSGSETGFAAMPGGLCMGVDPGRAIALSTSDGETHDVWVVSEGAEKPHTSLWQPQVQAALVQRSQRTLQSRVADNLFWLGRYLERADWTMRAIRTALGRRLEYLGSAPVSRAGDVSLEVLLSKGAKPRDASGSRSLAQQLVSQKEGMYGLAQTFDGIYRVASLTRDRLSLEAWRTLSTFRIDDAWRVRMQDATASEIQDEIEDRIAVVATFGGHMHENMTRNFGWFFLDMGKRLERAYNLCDSLNAHFAKFVSEDSEREHLRHILDLADSYITYRSRYRLEPMLPLVLDLLLIDETNPRSVAYQLKAMSNHLEALPQASDGNALTRERRMVLGLQTAIRLAEVNELGAAGASGERKALQGLLATALNDLPLVSDAISRRYFRLLDGEQHRVSMHVEPSQ
jgi:uncharacterized circularly permuted ATP-grasp superfamily protein/uncharacterized alpha-E superfamily protein